MSLQIMKFTMQRNLQQDLFLSSKIDSLVDEFPKFGVIGVTDISADFG